MKKINIIFLIVLYLISFSNIIGQNLSNPLSGETAPDSKYANIFVYLHTDRSCYLPGESVLFKAYFLDNLNNRSYPPDDTLKVELLDQEGIDVAFGLVPVTNNLISGSIELPDFLNEGNYILIASTRSMKNLSPDKMFSKIIEIKKTLENYLITDISLGDTLYEPGSLLTAQIRFSGQDNKPVPASFTYQLSGRTEEINTGNNKANNEGIATLKLQLPKFDSKETLKLIVVPSYKGTKNITGIVIPTQFNYTGIKTDPGRNLSTNESKHLNIQLKTINISDGKNSKVQLEIAVTDENGAPAMANLSVSVSNLISHQLPLVNDNILSYVNQKINQPDVKAILEPKEYFTQYLVQKTQSAGHPFIVQEKNNAKKLRKKIESFNQNKQEGYSSERNIYAILMEIKPYRMENGKIRFGISAGNSLNNPEGALIVVDGVKMGSDASILNTIPVPDIAKIKVLTNVMDIQRYSALNGEGIIEIFMKKGPGFGKNEETTGKTKSSTLFWGSDTMTDSAGKASVSFFHNDNSAEVLITVEGLAANGLCGSSSIHYTVK